MIETLHIDPETILYDITIRRIELEAQLKLCDIDECMLKDACGDGNPVLLSKIRTERDRIKEELNQLNDIEFEIRSE
jgi:hypothetical protein